MRCPKCGYLDSKVVDTRSSPETSSVKRKRVCLKCLHKFVTNEVICAEYPTVIKRDGRQEVFDLDKLKNGLLRAFKRSSDSIEKVNYVFNKVTSRVATEHADKIQSAQLGEIVMDVLREIDQVAYLRFASVCKNFESLYDVNMELKRLNYQN